MENKKKTVLKLVPSCIFLAIITGIFLKFYDASQREAKAEYLCSRITRALSLPCVYGDKPEDILLYKEYLAANYPGRESAYVFSYFDCDRDGKLELLIKQKDSEKIGSDIMKYEGNGLRDIYSSGFKNLSVKDIEWFEIARNEQIKADNPGIDVVIEEEGNWNWTRMWYSEEGEWEGEKDYYKLESVYGDVSMENYKPPFTITNEILH